MADIRLYNLCLIENPETRQVVALDKVSSPFAGITLPGGKVEKGESIAASVIREVREETGLSLGSWRFRGIVTFVSDEWGTEYMHLFTADSFTGALCPCDEGELEWVEKERIPSLPIWEGDRIFLRLLEEEANFFSLKLCYKGDKLVRAVLDGREELL